VFFLGRINRVLLYQDHRFPAAHQFTFAAVQNLDDVSTSLTFVNLQLFRHAFPPFHGLRLKVNAHVQKGRWVCTL
jgi:hypothetical protein